jgi:hypothetical protein
MSHDVTSVRRMNRTIAAGLLSELRFQARCLELGLEIAIPIGVERYDLVLRRDGAWQRVQIKTGRFRSGAVQYNACSNAEGVGKPVSYHGHADALGIYSPDLDRCYLIPIEECGRSEGRLRVDPPRNNQVSGVRWASAFEL